MTRMERSSIYEFYTGCNGGAALSFHVDLYGALIGVRQVWGLAIKLNAPPITEMVMVITALKFLTNCVKRREEERLSSPGVFRNSM